MLRNKKFRQRHAECRGQLHVQVWLELSRCHSLDEEMC